jgi:hypothetical protein
MGGEAPLGYALPCLQYVSPVASPYTTSAHIKNNIPGRTGRLRTYNVILI